MARAGVAIRHVRGACDAAYLVKAFDEELLMQLQLNVHRLVVVYRVPALDALDAATLAIRLIVGASSPSMPAGSSAGATRRSQETSAGTTSRLIATPSQVPIFSKTSSSNSMAHRHRPDDALLYTRGRPMRHPPVAAPCRVPRLGFISAVVLVNSLGHSRNCRFFIPSAGDL